MNNDHDSGPQSDWDHGDPEEEWLEENEFRGVKLALAGLLVVALVGAGGWWLWRSTSLPHASEDHVQQALAYMNTGQSMAALIELRNALQKNDDNARAHFLLGRLYLDNGETASAEKELRQARFLGYDEAQVVPLLARVYLAQGKNEQLLALGSNALTPTDRTSTGLSPQGSQTFPGSGASAVDPTQAVTPESDFDLLSRAQLLFSQQDLIGARAQVEALLALKANNPGALLLLGDIEVEEGDLDAAESAYGEAMQAALKPRQAQMKRALVRIQKLDYTKAQLDVFELLKRAPKNPGANYLQGIIYYETQNYQKAVASLLIAERDERRYPLSLLYAGISHFNLGNHDQARDYANRFHKMAPDNIFGRRLLAQLYMSSGDFEAAEEVLRPVVNHAPEDWVSLNLLANALLAQGRSEEGITLLSLVAELQPASATAQGRLGAGQLLAGDRNAGVQRLEAALEMDPEFKQADMLLVMNYVRQQDYVMAQAAAEAYRARNPSSAEPLGLLAVVYLAAGQPEKARQAAREALKIDPANTSAHYSIADAAIAEGDYDQARTHYENVLALQKNALPALLKLAELAAHQRDVARMVTLLQRAIKHHPNQIAPRVLMARYYLGRGDPAQVEVLFSDLSENLQNQPLVLEVLAQAQLLVKDYNQAESTLVKLIEKQPDSPQVHYQMALVHAARAETLDLERELMKSLEIDPDFIPSLFLIVRLYLDQGSPERAEPYLIQLREQAAEAPEILALEASYARLTGDDQKALAYAEQSYKEVPSTTTLLQLVEILHHQGDIERESIILEHWLSRHPQDARTRLAQANSSALQDDTERAIKQYQAVLEREQDNVVALNNLAWYLRETQPRLALAYAEKAASLDPDWAAAQDTLAVVALQNGNLRRARQAITKALEQLPNDPSVIYHSALISAREGEQDTARAVLGPLLVSGQDFPELDDAMALFLELKTTE
jgi:putative PEP-CTERM system TPR-repeat lipoprotein